MFHLVNPNISADTCIRDNFLTRSMCQNARLLMTTTFPMDYTPNYNDPRLRIDTAIMQYNATRPNMNSCFNGYAVNFGPANFVNTTFGIGNVGGLSNPSSSTPSNTAMSEEEKEYCEKFKNLRSLALGLAEFSKTPKEQKDELKELCSNNNAGSYKERYEDLKECYDEIGSTIVKEFLTSDDNEWKYDNSNGLGLGLALTKAGYERENTDADNAVKDFINDGDISEDILTYLGQSNPNNVNILDFLSSWYSQKEPKNILLAIMETGDPSDTDFKEQHNAIKSLSESLIKEGKKYLDSGSHAGDIDKAIKVLETLINKKAFFSTNIQDAFNNLYYYTRLAAAEKIEGDLISSYEEIDESVFRTGLILKDVSDDLDNEKIEVKKVNTDNISYPARDDESGEYEGAYVYELLNGNTDDEDDRKIAKALDTRWLNKDTIYDFLDSYYMNGGLKDIEGLIEALDDDCDNSDVTYEMKLNIIKSLIEYASDYTSNDAVKAALKDLNDVLEKWEGDAPSNPTNFNVDYPKTSFTNYNEKFDKCLRTLFLHLKRFKSQS